MKKKHASNLKLDAYEQELEDNFEKSKSVNNVKEEIELFKKAAGNYFHKDKRITIRIYGRDLERIKQMAVEEGLPYQTLITSILHKLSIGRLVAR